MLEAITPLLLTYDEMPNLERTFAPLAWAKRIVVVDSGSTDGTREWLARDPRVALFTRPLDSFAAQMVGAAYSRLWTVESSEMSDSWRDELAQEAYKMAAAMIRAREQG